VRLVYVLNFLFRLGFQASQPLLGLYLIDLGLQPSTAGLVMGVAGIVPVSLAPFLGQLADRVGPFRQVAVGGVISVAGYAGLALAQTPAQAAVYLALGWLGSFAATMAYQAYIAEQAYQGMGVEPFAWLGVAISLANSLAPAAAGLIAAWGGLPAVFWGSALLSATVFAGLPLMGRARTKAAHNPEAHVPLSHWIRDATSGFSVATALFTGLLVGHRNSYLPIHLDSQGLSVSVIGALLSVQAVAGVLIQTQLPRLARRFGSPPLVVTAFLIAAPVMALLPWMRPLPLLGGGLMLLGLATGMLHPLTMALTARAVPGRQQGLALGLRYTALRLGNMLGPPGFGLVAALSSVPATFTAAAVLASLGAMGGWLIVKRGQLEGLERQPTAASDAPATAAGSQRTE